MKLPVPSTAAERSLFYLQSFLLHIHAGSFRVAHGLHCMAFTEMGCAPLTPYPVGWRLRNGSCPNPKPRQVRLEDLHGLAASLFDSLLRFNAIAMMIPLSELQTLRDACAGQERAAQDNEMHEQRFWRAVRQFIEAEIEETKEYENSV